MQDNSAKIIPIYSGVDLRIVTLQGALEKVIYDFTETERASAAVVLGTLEIIKMDIHKRMQNE